jgi:glyoxylate/hydroxypyruvate reductase A
MKSPARSLLLIIKGWDQAGWARRFRALEPSRDVREWPDTGEPADIAYVGAWMSPPGSLAGLPGLKAIFSLGAGVDHLLRDPKLPRVPVVRVVDESLTRPMTEYIVAEVMRHHRQHPAYAEAQAARRWKLLPQAHAADVTVGILGLGILGCAAAGALLSLGFGVAGWSRRRKDIPGARSFAGAAELDAFLGETDILVSLLPTTPETRHLVDRAFLGKLKADGPLGGPVYINAGRGATQVEADILAALDAGELKGASIDVFETEPLVQSSPLWTHPGVVITPHAAADSDPDAISRYIVGQIHAFEAGEPLANAVDRNRGY